MDFLEGSLQVFELASCLLLQPQRCFHPPLHLPLFVRFLHTFFVQPRCFLETSGFFQITTPRVLFLLSQQPPRKSPKLPAPRADVTAAGCARPPRLCPASPLAASPSAESRLQASFFCVCHFRNAPARWRNVRSSCFRRVHARLGGESRTNRRHGRDRLGLAFWLCVQPVFSMKPAYFLLAASSSSFRICRS